MVMDFLVHFSGLRRCSTVRLYHARMGTSVRSK